MKSAWISGAYLAALWLWVASAAGRDWTENPDYGYGLFVLPLAGYFAFKRFRRLRPSAPSGFIWPARAAMLLPALLALPLELINLSPLPWRLATWGIFAVAAIGSAGLAVAAAGKNGLRAAIFPLLFASTAIPWPTALEQTAGQALLPLLAETTGELLRLGGIPVQRQGFLLILPNCVVGIEQACSGLRSLQAALMVALAAGEFLGLSLIRRGVLLALAPAVAIVTNLARTLALSLAGFHGGSAAIQTWHDRTGLAAMIACVLLLFAIAGLIRPKTASGSAPVTVWSPNQHVPGVALLILLLGLAGARGWYGWHETGPLIRHPAIALRAAAGTALPLPADLAALLNPDFGGYFRMHSAGRGSLTGYHFFWQSSPGTAAQLYHRPAVCMPGELCQKKW